MDYEYIKELKIYYEDGFPYVSDIAEKYAKEMIEGGATVIDYKPFISNEIRQWISGTEEMIGWSSSDGEEDEESIEIRELFPNLYDYRPYTNEIAAYFLMSDVKYIKDKVKEEDDIIIDILVKLSWYEMLPKNVTDVFLF